jgi:hypothetical protein
MTFLLIIDKKILSKILAKNQTMIHYKLGSSFKLITIFQTSNEN